MWLSRLINLWMLIALLMVGSLPAWAAKPANVGFYYGDEAPIGALYAYDWLVLQPTLVGEARLDLLRRGGTKPLAYVAVDEMARSHRLYPQVKTEWLLGENPAWNSVILDITRPEVQGFLLDQLILPALQRGFEGVFLDTLDSHRLSPGARNRLDDFAQAQANIIRHIKQEHPTAIVIANRGFHLPDNAKLVADALAFESYFSGYNPAAGRYESVPEPDRQWLDKRIAEWLSVSPDSTVIAIDYTATHQEGLDLSRQLRASGMVPVVTNQDLTRLSPTTPARVVNHLLVLHDLPPSATDHSHAHARLGIILEQLGFVPEYRSIDESLPREPLADKYSGVAVWWQTGQAGGNICRWLEQNAFGHMPLVLLGTIPNSSTCRTLTGAAHYRTPFGDLTIEPLHSSVGQFEGTRFPPRTKTALPQAEHVNAWITVKDNRELQYAPVFTSAAGGSALAPFLFEAGPDNTALWLFDPVVFMREALRPAFEVAVDTTTESGRRIVTSHIDGDGFVSRAEQAPAKIAGQVILEEILHNYPIPHTVSVIEAEVSAEGIFPEQSQVALDTARKIFQAPNIEVASHSFSHPYFWPVIEGGPAPPPEDTLYGYSLPVAGYEINLQREIPDSVEFVNTLTPANRPTRVFLWSGDARPGPQALALVRRLGLVNVNGGNTRPLPYHSQLADVWPDGRPVGDELQVYAPVMNENVYTNLWTGPFYGFRHARDSFTLLDQPYRLKPAGVYYHFYSATKPDALKALKEVYDAALAAPNTPVPLSAYAQRVQSRYYSALTVDEEGSYHWRGYQYPHSVLIPSDRYPDLERSRGVSGYVDHGRQRFVHLVGADHSLQLTDKPGRGPYLRSANVPVTAWQRTELAPNLWRLRLSVSGYVPAELDIGGAQRCTLSSQHAADIRGTRLRLSTHRAEGLELECQ